MPKVSVIIPTHNRARVVGDAVESVLAQTYRDSEIIVVDDGSTDRTREVVAPYVRDNGGRVTYVWQKSAGAAAARNAGIRLATSDYVAFLDSDDLYMPRRLEVGVDVLEGDPRFGASYVDGCTIDADGNLLLESRITRFGGIASGWILPALLSRDLIQTNAITIRRAALEDVGGFDETLWSGQDTDLWWRLAKRWQMVGVAETLVVVRELASSLSRGRGTKTDRLKRLSVWIEGQAKYLSAWTDLPFSVRRLLARRIWDLHHEQERILVDLRARDALDVVREQMRGLESAYHLRLHALRRRLGRHCPRLQQSWRQAGIPSLPPHRFASKLPRAARG
jgi:hypothetical protein